MPLLAVSDTPLSRRLLQEGKLEVELFETSGPLSESVVETRSPTRTPFLLHNGVWNWSLGHPEAFSDSDVLGQTRERLALTGAPCLSVHLGYSTAQVEFKRGSGFVPASVPAEPLARDALFTAITQNLRALQKAINVPLLIEGLDYNPTGAYEHVCEPEFMAEVLGATDASLLLDLAHAQVSASRLGYELEAYLAALPLKRVKQLHVSGPRSDGKTLFDAHEPLREEDYELVADILERTDPWALTLEYGKDEQAFLEQTTRLRQLIG